MNYNNLYIGLITLILFSCETKNKDIEVNIIDSHTSVNEANTNKLINAPIKYKISLDKNIFSSDESIELTLKATNISNSSVKIWIDGGSYPIGTELEFIDSHKNSVIHQFWAIMSSKAYLQDEVEELKTLIKPGESFSKTYLIETIVQLKKEYTPLPEGKYTLAYDNAEKLEFEIKN